MTGNNGRDGDVSHAENRGRNLVGSVGGHLVALLVGFWFVPFLRKSLGGATYGQVATATNFVAYFSVAVSSLGPAVQREMGAAVCDEHRKLIVGESSKLASKVALGFWIAAVLCLVLSIVEESLGWLLFAGFASLGIEARVITNAAWSLAAGRAYHIAYANIARALSRPVVYLVLAFGIGAGVGSYSLALLSGTVAYCLVMAIWAPVPQPKGPRSRSRDNKGSLVRTASWAGLAQVGDGIWGLSEVVLVSWVWGWEAAGLYALALHWVTAGRGLVLGLIGAPLAEVLDGESSLSTFPVAKDDAVTESVHIAESWLTMISWGCVLTCWFIKEITDLWLPGGLGDSIWVTWLSLLSTPMIVLWHFAGMTALGRGRVAESAYLNNATALGTLLCAWGLAQFMSPVSVAGAFAFGHVIRGVIVGPLMIGGVAMVRWAVRAVSKVAAHGAVATAMFTLLSSGRFEVRFSEVLAPLVCGACYIGLSFIALSPEARRYVASYLNPRYGA